MRCGEMNYLVLSFICVLYWPCKATSCCPIVNLWVLISCDVCWLCYVDEGFLSVPQVEGIQSLERQRALKESSECKANSWGKSVLFTSCECPGCLVLVAHSLLFHLSTALICNGKVALYTQQSYVAVGLGLGLGLVGLGLGLGLWLTDMLSNCWVY